MTHLRTRLPELVSGALDNAIADWLTQLLGPARPRRVARMYDPGQGDKYRDIPRSAAFTRAQLRQHAAGVATWACTLDEGGCSRLGVIEVDTGGRLALLAVLAAAAEQSLTAWAIAVDNPLSGHAGGHVWVIYDQPAPAAAIVAQLRTVATAAGLPEDTEIWPCNQVIRLPLGYHRWARTRGELLTQAGEVVNLDTDLAAGVDLVLSMPQNGVPPAVSTIVETEVNASTASTKKERRISLGEQAAAQMPARHADSRIDTKAIAAEVRTRFNNETAWSDLLSDAGGTEMRPGYWACNCGVQHEHDIQIAVTSRDKIISLSNRCGWAQQDKALDKFGFYINQVHGGNYHAAIEKQARAYGLWVAPALLSNSAPARSLPEYVLSPEERQRRAAEAERKKAARKHHAAETLADVRARAAADTTLRDADRAVLDALLTIAGDRDWCRPSKERLVIESGYSLGAVKRSLMILEGRQYFTSDGNGGKKGKNQTAIRTFLCGSFEPAPAPEMIHKSLRTCDLDTDSRACERAPIPQPDRALLSRVRDLAKQVAEPGWVLRDYAELDEAALRDEASRLEGLLAQRGKPEIISVLPPAAAPTTNHVAEADFQVENGSVVTGPAGAVAVLGGAAYVPPGAEAWYQAMQQAIILPLAVGEADQVEATELLDVAPEAEPLVRSAPVEPTAAREYWSLKHKKPVNATQARWIAHRLAALEIWIPASQALALEPPAAAAAPVRAIRRRAGRQGSALSAEIPQMPAGAQLQLELAPP